MRLQFISTIYSPTKESNLLCASQEFATHGLEILAGSNKAWLLTPDSAISLTTQKVKSGSLQKIVMKVCMLLVSSQQTRTFKLNLWKGLKRSKSQTRGVAGQL